MLFRSTRTQAVIQSLFRQALGRLADEQEIKLAKDLLVRHADKHRQAEPDKAEHRALVDLCRAILNLNEFVYLD